MYREYKGGTTEHIQGLDVNIPPVGYVYNVLTKQMEKRTIYARSSKKSEQYWKREPLPDFYSAEKCRKLVSDPNYINNELEEYITREWDRRLNGFWFYNNGIPTYITGLHYYYLQWTYIASKSRLNYGYPDFWEEDRRFFYFLGYAIEDPRCTGVVYCTKRRAGKTAKSVAFILEPVTRTKESAAGIQSKTEKDAKIVVFKKGVVRAFKKLPEFFMPEYDTNSSLITSIEFTIPQTRGKESRASLTEKSLESVVDWRASTETAYDGDLLTQYVGDEIFKSLIDIEERHKVIEKCLTDTDGNLLGKAFYTSTVEEIEGYTDIYKKFWKESGIDTRDPETGITDNGLYHYFTPADLLRDRDVFGFCDQERNREWIIARRPDRHKDPKGYYSSVRKDPLSIEEAFKSSGQDCLFNDVKINEQLDYISWQDNNYTIGNFIYKNGERDTEVIFKPEHNGRFKVRLVFEEPTDANQVQERSKGRWAPLNTAKFVMGIDPYDHDTTVDNRRSDAAAYVFKKQDSSDPDFSNSPVVEYVARPQTAKIFYEDMIKLCRYFGCQMLFENQKQGIKNYFKDRGYEAFLIKLPGRNDYGIPSSPATKQEMAEEIEAYVENYCGNIWFPRLLEDLLKFDISKTQIYDPTMAFGWTLVANKLIKFRQKSAATHLTKPMFKKFDVVAYH